MHHGENQETQPNTARTRHGFTLVELSIVLVVIGLLSAGIIVGRDMIEAAKVRATITEFQSYSTALNTFREKYNCIPGDCLNATEIFDESANCDTAALLNANETCDGNGDGMVVWTSGHPNHAEMFTFWQQLSLAGMVEGKYSGTRAHGIFPASSVAGVNAPSSRMGDNTCWSFIFTSHPTQSWNYSYAIFPQPDSNMFILGDPFGAPMDPTNPDPNNPWNNPGGPTNPDYCWQGAFTPANAYGIDSKMDDGKPGTGRTRAWRDRNLLCRSTDDETTSEYNVANTNKSCGILITPQ